MTNDKLTARQFLRAIGMVIKTLFSIAPFLLVLQAINSIISAALPITTTYFAALTTTNLAEAYAGVAGADQKVITYLLVTVLLGIFGKIWDFIKSHLLNLLEYEITTSVTDRLYEHFFAIDFFHYDDNKIIDMYEKSSRFVSVFPYLFSRLVDAVTSIITFIIASWALATINIWLALLTVVTIVPGGLIQFKISRLENEHWQKNVETRRRLNWLEWRMAEPAHVVEFRLYSVVRHLLNLRVQLRDKDTKSRIDIRRKFMPQRLLAFLLSGTPEIASLVWVTTEIIAHRQPIGQFIFVQQTVQKSAGSISSLLFLLSNMSQDLVSLFDYQKFMELPEMSVKDLKLPEFSQAIKINNVSFCYQNSKTEVLKNIFISINKGERIAIVGENGAGKTTLLRLIGGLYKPTKGKITVDDHDLDLVDIESWHRQLSVLSQDFVKYGFATANENVWLGDVSKKPRQKNVSLALKQAEAANFVNDLPNRGDSYVDKWLESNDGTKGVELSGGQWQRLALARNFYRDSPIVLLDEPTSAIDALAEARIFNRLFKESDKTIIIVSHRLTIVEKADTIYMLKNGKISEFGNHKDLINKRGDYYEMFKSQLHQD